MVLDLYSTPTVTEFSEENIPSVNWIKKQDLPIPEVPIIITLKLASRCVLVSVMVKYGWYDRDYYILLILFNSILSYTPKFA